VCLRTRWPYLTTVMNVDGIMTKGWRRESINVQCVARCKARWERQRAALFFATPTPAAESEVARRKVDGRVCAATCSAAKPEQQMMANVGRCYQTLQRRDGGWSRSWERKGIEKESMRRAKESWSVQPGGSLACSRGRQAGCSRGRRATNTLQHSKLAKCLFLPATMRCTAQRWMGKSERRAGTGR
jgi:hypothetical protein